MDPRARDCPCCASVGKVRALPARSLRLARHPSDSAGVMVTSSLDTAAPGTLLVPLPPGVPADGLALRKKSRHCRGPTGQGAAGGAVRWQLRTHRMGSASRYALDYRRLSIQYGGPRASQPRAVDLRKSRTAPTAHACPERSLRARRLRGRSHRVPRYRTREQGAQCVRSPFSRPRGRGLSPRVRGV